MIPDRNQTSSQQGFEKCPNRQIIRMHPTETRVAIVGAGSIVRHRHLPGLRNIAGVRVTAVANSTTESTSRFLREENLDARIMEHWKDLVTADDVDAVWIGTRPDLHEPVTVAALQAGKHVFCQARMARDLAEARRMLAASELAPALVTMLCPPPYGLRQDAHVKRLLAEKAAGTIKSLTLESLSGDYLDPAEPAHWRQRREVSGKNVMTLGIYTEVIQRWFGPILWVEAEGRIATRVRQGYQVDIPEELVVRAEFADGTPARLNFSTIHKGPPAQALTLVGSMGTLKIDFVTEEISLMKGSTASRLETPPSLSRPWRVEKDFIEAVRAPLLSRPRPDFADGLAYMKVVDAVDEAWRCGTRVSIA